MTIEQILEFLDYLGYVAEKKGKPQEERIFYKAAALIRAGQVMRDEDPHTSGAQDWDEVTKGDI